MEMRKGYKWTEVGVIPEEWEVKNLKEVFKLKNGYAFSSQFFSKDGPIVITPGNFKIEGGLVFNNRNTIRYSGEITPIMQFSNGDLLIVMTDLTPDCNLLGKPGFVDTYETILHNQRIGKIQLNGKGVSLNYLYWFFLSEAFSKRMKTTATGSTVRHTSNGSIYNTILPIPTQAEQTAIATALTDMDKLISGLEGLLAKKRAVKQGAMGELLKAREGWEVKRLGEAATLKARIGWQGLTTSEYLKQGNYFLVTGTDFSNGKIDWENCHYVDYQRYAQDVNIQLQIGDVLVTKDGTIGKIAYIDKMPQSATLNSGVFVIRPKQDSFSSLFFYYFLTSEYFTDYLKKLTAGSTISHLYQKDFVHFEFHLPSEINEQNRIASILSDIDSEISDLELQLTKYRRVKAGMMGELLTGKTRLI